MEHGNSKAKAACAEQHHSSWESPLEEPGNNPKVCLLHTLLLPRVPFVAAVQPLPGAGVGSLEFPPGIQVTLGAPAVAPIPDIPQLITSFGSGIFTTDRVQGAEMTFCSSSNKSAAGTGIGGQSEQRKAPS